MRQIRFEVPVAWVELPEDGHISVLVDVWDISTGEESYSPPTIAFRGDFALWSPPTDAHADDGAPAGYWSP